MFLHMAAILTSIIWSIFVFFLKVGRWLNCYVWGNSVLESIVTHISAMLLTIYKLSPLWLIFQSCLNNLQIESIVTHISVCLNNLQIESIMTHISVMLLTIYKLSPLWHISAIARTIYHDVWILNEYQDFNFVCLFVCLFCSCLFHGYLFIFVFLLRFRCDSIKHSVIIHHQNVLYVSSES